MTHASKTWMTPAWRVGPAIIVVLAMAIAPATTSRGQARPQELAPVPGTYRTDRLGLEYRLLPYRGHYGAAADAPAGRRLAVPEAPAPDGSPSYLEPGDMIVTLDDQIIDGPADIENHVVRTKVDFVNFRTRRPEVVWAMFPNDARPGPRRDPIPAPRPSPTPAPRPSPTPSPLRRPSRRRRPTLTPGRRGP